MIDEARLKLGARLLTLEYFVQFLMKIEYEKMGVDKEWIERAHASLREHARTRTIPGSDPAFSDLAASELEAAFDEFLTGLESMLGWEGSPRP